MFRYDLADFNSPRIILITDESPNRRSEIPLLGYVVLPACSQPKRPHNVDFSKRYVIRDTIACRVTWSYGVEADSEEEAMRKFRDGEHDAPLELPEIGDCIEWVDQQTTVEKTGSGNDS